MLKYSEKKYFSGVFGGTQNPPFCIFRGFGDPYRPLKLLFFAIFQHLIDLFGLSAFQRAFTFYFTLTLSWYKMFLVKLGFLAQNLGDFTL